jgi:hypothetical protein
MRQLLPFFSISLLAIYALFAWAHEGELDALGCHEDPVTTSYHCHKGQLEGREFVNRGEAEDALKASAEQKADDKADEQALTDVGGEGLRVLSWNLSKVGTEKFEYDRVANILSEGDVVVLQGVEFTKTGETSLTVITGLMSRKLNEKICKAWFKSDGGERAQHAFLWKDSRVGYVEKNGEIRESCSEAPQVIHVDGKKINPLGAYYATFYHKSKKRMFVLASVHMPKSKKPAKEIPAFFKKIAGFQWPTLLAGSFGTGSRDKAFQDVKKLEFKPALGAIRKGATDNFWAKNLAIVRSESIDLYERYPELSKAEVDKTVAGSFPLAAEISFNLDEDQLKTEVIKKPLRDKSSIAPPVKAPVKEDVEEEIPEAKPMQLQDTSEDIESEESQTGN